MKKTFLVLGIIILNSITDLFAGGVRVNPGVEVDVGPGYYYDDYYYYGPGWRGYYYDRPGVYWGTPGYWGEWYGDDDYDDWRYRRYNRRYYRRWR